MKSVLPEQAARWAGGRACGRRVGSQLAGGQAAGLVGRRAGRPLNTQLFCTIGFNKLIICCGLCIQMDRYTRTWLFKNDRLVRDSKEVSA